MGTTDNLLRRTLRVGWKLALAGVVAAFAVYRVRFAPVPVDSRAAATGPIVSEVMGTGTLEARYSATISPRISGLVTDVLVDQGERVTKGQLLARLYDGDLRQQVAIANAECGATRAGVDRAAADIVRAQANAVQARASYARMQPMIGSGAVSIENAEKATQQRDVAEAELKRSELAKVEAERQVVMAEENLRYYQERLADTKVTCPFDGLVVRRGREPGDVVVPGSEILQVVSTEQMWVSAWVDETAMASLAVGQPARVVFRSEPDRSYAGTLTRTAPLADRETREFLVDVTVKDLPRAWAVGQRAEVYVRTARKDDALQVPEEAVVWQKGRPGLFVLGAAGRARWREVTVGLRGAESVEVTKGLAPGDTVVWLRDPKDGPLTDGRTVRLR
jgi:HlyD family secretion protein